MIPRSVILILFLALSPHVLSNVLVMDVEIFSAKPSSKDKPRKWDKGPFPASAPDVYVSLNDKTPQEMQFRRIYSYNHRGYYYSYEIVVDSIPSNLFFTDKDMVVTDIIGEANCSNEHCSIIHPSGEPVGVVRMKIRDISKEDIDTGLVESFINDVTSRLDSSSAKNSGAFLKNLAEFKFTKSPESAVKLIASALALDESSPLYTKAKCMLVGVDIVTRDPETLGNIILAAGTASLAAFNSDKLQAVSAMRACYNSTDGSKTGHWDDHGCDSWMENAKKSLGCNTHSSCMEKGDLAFQKHETYDELSRASVGNLFKNECAQK